MLTLELGNNIQTDRWPHLNVTFSVTEAPALPPGTLHVATREAGFFRSSYHCLSPNFVRCEQLSSELSSCTCKLKLFEVFPAAPRSAPHSSSPCEIDLVRMPLVRSDGGQTRLAGGSCCSRAAAACRRRGSSSVPPLPILISTWSAG